MATKCNYNAETRVIFEWDERKRQENVHKHGFDFVDCAAVFAGPLVIVADVRFDYAESRSRAMGLLGDRVVAVAYAELGETVRVISMRKASKREQASFIETLRD